MERSPASNTFTAWRLTPHRRVAPFISADRALMRLRSSGIMNCGNAREVSGRAEAHARRKPGVFRLAARCLNSRAFALLLARRDQWIAVAEFAADQCTAGRADGVSDNACRTNAGAAREHRAREK